MNSIQGKIRHYSQKLASLQAKLEKFQKGVSVKLRRQAISTIFEIERIEEVLVSLQSVQSKIVEFKRCVRKLRLETPRRSYRSWVAKLSPERDKKHGGFVKSFFEPTSREFGKKGESAANFEIPVVLDAIYQDSDGDFWMFENMQGDIQVISYQEAKYRLEGGSIDVR